MLGVGANAAYNIIDLSEKYCALVPDRFFVPVSNIVYTEYDPFSIYATPAAQPNNFTAINAAASAPVESISDTNVYIAYNDILLTANFKKTGIICDTVLNCLVVVPGAGN